MSMARLVKFSFYSILLLILGLVTGARAEETSALETRHSFEERTLDNPFAIAPHKPNYLLPLSYNKSPNGAPFAPRGSDLDQKEVKFQFSFKFPLWNGLDNGAGRIYLAYTNLSFWQAYNRNNSSPFRETNHEPEAFMFIPSGLSLLGVTNTHLNLGISHQSNGRSGTQSRSWNRVYLSLFFQRGDFYLALKPWYRLPEGTKADPEDPDGDDNPDIEKFLGHGELGMLYKFDGQSLALMVRNNLRSDNKGAVQLDYTFPLTGKLKGYVQYFNGYGESLIDYNASAHRLGIGILLTDWL